MSTPGIVGEVIDKQAALASAALRNISALGAGARQLLPRAVLDMLAPYSVAHYLAEGAVQSEAFNADLVQMLHSRLLPLERMADDMLAAARKPGYFDDPHKMAEPLRRLEACNEQVKDCMVATVDAGPEARRPHGRGDGGAPAGRSRSTRRSIL